MTTLRYPVRVLRVRVPARLLGELDTLTGTLLGMGTQWDYAYALAGRIRRGAQVRIPNTEDAPDPATRARLFAWLTHLARRLLVRGATTSAARRHWARAPLELDDAWCVRQLAGDDNPLHGHDGLVSGVLYLRVPPPVTTGPDGWLAFVHSDPFREARGRERDPARLLDLVEGPVPDVAAGVGIERYRVRPVVGEAWVFPSWLLHEVPPFEGPGERRSLAFNVRRPLAGAPLAPAPRFAARAERLTLFPLVRP